LYLDRGDNLSNWNDSLKAGAPTCVGVRQDLLYFLNQSANSGLADSVRRCYARGAIVFMAFYFESLSQLLEHYVREKHKWTAGLPEEVKPLKRFIDAYFSLFNTQLSLDCNGIKDLFLIRNQVIAHPSGISQFAGGREMVFRKFMNFPSVYADYNWTHAEELSKELKRFLCDFSDLIKDKVNEEWLLLQFQLP